VPPSLVRAVPRLMENLDLLIHLTGDEPPPPHCDEYD
jgi:hypothetical protein